VGSKWSSERTLGTFLRGEQAHPWKSPSSKSFATRCCLNQIKLGITRNKSQPAKERNRESERERERRKGRNVMVDGVLTVMTNRFCCALLWRFTGLEIPRNLYCT
jgi:hypothetical protein